MAKVSFRNLNKLIKNIESVLDDTKQSKQLLRDLGETAADRVKTQTQTGKQLTTSRGKPGPVRRQPPLSPGYIQYRRRLASGKVKDSSVKPSDLMRPSLSHLTLTGQLLNSLDYKVFPRLGRIEVFPTGKRNINVTEDLAERGRTYLGMDEKGLSVLRNKILRVLRRNIRNFNK